MSDVEKLEKQLEDGKFHIERREQALRLYRNPDFKALIMDEFIVQECARYAQNSANPQLSENERKDCLNIAQAAGHLKRFLSVMIQMGNAAEHNKPAIEQAILEARQEGSD